jgi:hypothetical protein
MEKLVGDNSPLILTGIGAAGVLTTAYLTGKAVLKADRILERHKSSLDPENWRIVENRLDKGEKFQLIWKEFIPPAASAGLTITAIILANRIGTRRAAAVAAAFTTSERVFQEYREEVVQKLGKKKEQEVRDTIAQRHVDQTPNNAQVIVSGTNVLCFDKYTGRYFESDMESIKHAQNKINHKINGSVYASLNDFYTEIGLPRTAHGDEIGWSNHLLEIVFSTTMSDDGKPCLAIDFSVEPIRNYDKIHP